jgi:hypothetical protein
MSLPVYDLRTHRLKASPAEEVGALIDSPAGPHDGLWARDLWPEMRFDRPLVVGADGGHGPVLYAVEAYEPGRRSGTGPGPSLARRPVKTTERGAVTRGGRKEIGDLPSLSLDARCKSVWRVVVLVLADHHGSAFPAGPVDRK